MSYETGYTVGVTTAKGGCILPYRSDHHNLVGVRFALKCADAYMYAAVFKIEDGRVWISPDFDTERGK